MRWGIVDVETWLKSIEPAVMSRWIVYASVEPEAFALAQGASGGNTPARPQGVTPMMPAANVGELFARLYER